MEVWSAGVELVEVEAGVEAWLMEVWLIDTSLTGGWLLEAVGVVSLRMGFGLSFGLRAGGAVSIKNSRRSMGSLESSRSSSSRLGSTFAAFCSKVFETDAPFSSFFDDCFPLFPVTLMDLSFCINLPFVLFFKLFGLGMTGGLVPPPVEEGRVVTVNTSSFVYFASPSTLSDSEASLLLLFRLRVEALLLGPDDGGFFLAIPSECDRDTPRCC